MITEFAPPEILTATRREVHDAITKALKDIGVELPRYTQGVMFDIAGITVVELPTSTGDVNGIEVAGNEVIRVLRHYRHADSLTTSEQRKTDADA